MDNQKAIKHNMKNQQFFLKWADSYDKGIIKFWLFSMQKHAIKEILQHKSLQHKNNKTELFNVLDIGCGTGQLLLQLVNKFPKAKLYGIDLTKSMLDIARKKLKQYTNIKLQQASVEQLPFENKKFDYVVTTEAFHHFPEPDKALQEMMRVLKDNGKIILIDINFGYGLSYLIHKLEPGNYHIYSKEDFQQLFNKHKLKLLEQKRIGVIAIYNLVCKMEETKKNKVNITKLELAAFAAGCFWGIEEVFRTTDGVKNTAVGYIGGKTKNPNYENVCTDGTGHAEAVQLQFDPKEISYEKLLDIFWNIHDPTTINKQGPDIGSQYRSVVFCYTEQQKQIAEKMKLKLQNSGKFKNKIVTEIVSAPQFYKAEEYHQKYLMKKGKNTCH